jgi:oligopeptidase B
MGVVLNMAPELYNSNCPGPFRGCSHYDVRRYDSTNDRGVWWMGNPNVKNIMAIWSPILLMITWSRKPILICIFGLHDSQVQYWEPAKWVAKLRTLKPTTFISRHEYGCGSWRRIWKIWSSKELAKEFSFFVDLEKIKNNSEIFVKLRCWEV